MQQFPPVRDQNNLVTGGDLQRGSQLPSSDPINPFNYGSGTRVTRPRGQPEKIVDYISSVVKYIEARTWQRDSRDRASLQPTPAAALDMLPTVAYSDNPSISFAAKFFRFREKNCSINRVVWTPTGGFLITGSENGEFTLWNGKTFKFEMILQAHDQPIRSMVWSHNDNFMISGDDGGTIKCWRDNTKIVNVNQTAHWWQMAGHGCDVKSVDWHPTKSLLVSGGKDRLVKLWDARTKRELCSLHGHKNLVLSVKWNQNGNWLLTASNDQIIKLYDIRTMKELESFRWYDQKVTSLAWHPFHEEYFVSGSSNGSICHWVVGHENPPIQIRGAHDKSVLDLAWHPIGYLLCSGSYDHSTKLWCRNSPAYNPQNQGSSERGFRNRQPDNLRPFVPGLTRNEVTIPGIGLAIQFDASSQGEHKQPLPGSGAPLQPPPQPPCLHPSIRLSGQQQEYQQLHQGRPQIIPNMPHNHLPPSSRMQLHPHHLPRPMQMPPHGHRPPSSMHMPHHMPGSMQSRPGLVALGAPPQPPGPHPSIRLSGQQQGYQQQQHQGHPQIMPNIPHHYLPPSYPHHVLRPIQMPPHGYMPPSSMPMSHHIPGPMPQRPLHAGPPPNTSQQHQ